MARIAMTIAVPDLTGASRMLYYYAIALRDAGHDVVVVHGTPPVDSRGQPASIVTELQAESISTQHVSLLRRPLPPFVYSRVHQAAGNCQAIIGVNQRDRAVAAKVAAMLDVPCLLAIQSMHNFWGPAFVPAVKRWYYRRTVNRHAHAFICSSSRVRDELVNELRVAPSKCAVLPNGIAISREASGVPHVETRDALGLTEQDRLYVNVGRLDVQKGQDLLLTAWAQAGLGPHAHLVLVGDVTEGGQYQRSKRFKEQLLKRRSELNLDSTVHFLGWRDDVKELLGASNVYVHSARWEGWPLAVLEAMSCKLPVITTDCAGHPFGFVNGVHGRVISKENVSELTRALRDFHVLTTSELHQMGKVANELCCQVYDIVKIGKRFVEIVEAAIESRDTDFRGLDMNSVNDRDAGVELNHASQ